MDCAVCGKKPSTGYCVECNVHLCADCGNACETCGKLVCAEHIFENNTYGVLCVECAADRGGRRAKRRPKRRARRRKESADTADETRTFDPLPPWQLANVNACLGAMAAAMLFIFPGLRRLPLPGGILVPTPFLVAILPASALIWTLVGVLRKQHVKHRRWCYVAGVVALGALALSILAYWNDPLRG